MKMNFDDEKKSHSLMDFLPMEAIPGQWHLVQADTPLGVEQLNEATAYGWDMVQMIPYMDRMRLTYVAYFQYHKAIVVDGLG